jgi:HTH-type transcriptional regulator/antitoxin HigA
MTESLSSTQPREVSPPGATLRDLMEERDWKQRELAHRLGRPVQAVNEILAGKKEITEDTALELERVLQVPAQFWLAREAQFREYLARRRSAEAFERARALAGTVSAQGPARRGRVACRPADGRFKAESGGAAAALLRRGFAHGLGGALRPDAAAVPPRPPQEADRRGRHHRVAAHGRTAGHDGTSRSTAHRAAGRFASHARTEPAPADRIGPSLVRLCAEAGVALVFVQRCLERTCPGVARWLNGKPLIQLSLLGKWNDGFWFSFFHEVAHVLKHPTRAIFLDDAAAGDTVESAEEQEANRFATDTLLPRALQAELDTLALNAASIQAFAARAGIHPGIVVGQLQHRGG